MKDLWIVIPDFKYLVHIQECDQEDCTIDYSVYKYENTYEISKIIADEDLTYEPYDGGWYTIEDTDISEAITTAPNAAIDELVEFICDEAEETPDYGIVEVPDDNISTDED